MINFFIDDCKSFIIESTWISICFSLNRKRRIPEIIKIMFVDHAPKNGLMRIPCPSARNKLLSIITMKYIIKAIVPLPLRLLLELVIPIGHAIRAMAMHLRGKAHL